ncbi:hypothetical protein AHAS_Ahas11G0082100 [Arachis hypogaea]
MIFNSYLVTVMGLVIPWSITLLVVDAYSVFIKCLPHQRRLIFMILLGDMNMSHTSGFVISIASGSVFDGRRHRSPAGCGRILLSAKVVQQISVVCCYGLLVLVSFFSFLSVQLLDFTVFVNYFAGCSYVCK